MTFDSLFLCKLVTFAFLMNQLRLDRCKNDYLSPVEYFKFLLVSKFIFILNDMKLYFK